MKKQIPLLKKFQAVFFSFVVLSLGACDTFLPSYEKPSTTRIIERKNLKGEKEAPIEGRFAQEGIASWYGPNFHKKKTANGEVYDMNKMTAAHRTIPFNVYVKVTNLETQKSVIVRVNDRGPFVGDRIIDLTRIAAYKIGMLEQGTAHVRVEGLGFKRVRDGRQVFVSPASWEIEGTFTLQVGSFRDSVNARSLLEQLKKSFSDVHLTELEVAKVKYFRVLVGKYKDPQDAEQDLVRLIEAGFKGAHLLTE